MVSTVKQFKFGTEWLKITQRIYFSTSRLTPCSNSSSREEKIKQEASKAARGPTRPRQVNAGSESPFVYASVNVQDVLKSAERPFMYNRRKERKHNEMKYSNRNSQSEKNKTKRKGSNLTIETQNREEHSTIKFAMDLCRTDSKEGKISKSKASRSWKPKPPIDYINEYFLKNQAHLLGLSRNELQNRFAFLSKIGLSKADSLTVALHFPSSLNLNSSLVENLAKLYATYKVDLTRLFVMYPFVFSLNHDDVSKRLDQLGSAGLKKKEVGDLITTNPLILCFGLNDSSKDSLKFCSGLSGWKSSSGKSLFIEAIVKSSLTERAVKYEFNEMFESITSFLEQLKIPVNSVFKRCPEFFSTDMETIYRVMHYLTDAPLFFDLEALSRFIHKYPGTYLQFDNEKVKSRIKHVQETLGDESELYEIIQATPRMFTHSACLESRIALFLNWKFSSKQISNLMKRCPLFFYENRVVENLGERLEFLLGSKDLNVNQIMKFPSCLQMRLAVLTCKIGYIRSHKPEILKAKDLQVILMSSHDKFAVELCGTSLQSFHDYIDDNFSSTDANLVKKFSSNNQRRKIRESNKIEWGETQ